MGKVKNHFWDEINSLKHSDQYIPEYFVFRTLDTTKKSLNGSFVSIVRELTESEADLQDVGKMYLIRFFNGTTIPAFEDELSRK